MAHTVIDPLDKPLRGIKPIARFIGAPEQITRRLILKGEIDADRDVRIWFTTPRRILGSRYVVGRKTANGAAAAHNGEHGISGS